MHSSEGVLLRLVSGSLDLSITVSSAWTMIATALLCVFLITASRKPGIVPSNPLQNILEYGIEFVDEYILSPAGLQKGTWTPLFLSLFLFVFINNFIGIIPGVKASTGNINATAALAAMVFLTGNLIRISRSGPMGFFRGLVPEGVTGPLLTIMVPIEFISQIAKPFSLAVRLFANMTGGHMILATLLGFIVVFKNVVIGTISVGGVVIISMFELFIDLIQAYVFAFLSAMLVSECLETHDGKEHSDDGLQHSEI